MKANVLVVHGGAPTAVINASLYGVLRESASSGSIGRVYGAKGGTAGFIAGDFIDLTALDDEVVERLPFTPASFIGTSRHPVDPAGYDTMADVLQANGIGIVLFNGGNGSMDTCGKLAKAVARHNLTGSIRIVGIPKTIDNDIAVTDHAPGFGSAARYLAASVRELACDVASLPIHVCIIESMGRNAGWLTAAASLAGEGVPPGHGPHLIYVPEAPFDEERFLDEAQALYRRFGGVVVVASEGLRSADGTPIVPPIFQTGRSVYYGDVSAHLCNLVVRRLGIKARSEKPGILGRCSIAHQSAVDREEAVIAGREAVKAALAGHTSVMVGFKRLSDEPYACEPCLIPIEEVMLHERTLERSFLSDEGTRISASFGRWCRPLLGGPFDRLATLG